MTVKPSPPTYIFTIAARLSVGRTTRMMLPGFMASHPALPEPVCAPGPPPVERAGERPAEVVRRALQEFVLHGSGVFDPQPPASELLVARYRAVRPPGRQIRQVHHERAGAVPRFDEEDRLAVAGQKGIVRRVLRPVVSLNHVQDPQLTFSEVAGHLAHSRSYYSSSVMKTLFGSDV